LTYRKEVVNNDVGEMSVSEMETDGAKRWGVVAYLGAGDLVAFDEREADADEGVGVGVALEEGMEIDLMVWEGKGGFCAPNFRVAGSSGLNAYRQLGFIASTTTTTKLFISK
jgi:hypothetical protein